MEYHVRHFNLQGACNNRELGGYATRDGGMTAWGRFIRCEVTTYLTEADKKILKGWGLRTVIDLRAGDELMQYPNAFQHDPDIHFINCTVANVDKAGQDTFQWPDDMPIDGIYAYITVKAPQWVAGVLKAIADAPEGGILFHCHAGKDRTGVIAAILLHMAGVSMDDIAADYMLTQTYYREELRKAEAGGYWAETYLRLSPFTMEQYFARVAEACGSMDAYLQSLPLPPGTLEKVTARFL